MRFFTAALSLAVLIAPSWAFPQEQKSTSELVPRRAECGIFLPARDERHDVARLIRSTEFVDCERDGFPKSLAPPWKTSDEATKRLADACEYFSAEYSKQYAQVRRDDLELAADRCRIEVMGVILTTLVPK